MALIGKHKKTCVLSDSQNPLEIQPSDWNDDIDINGHDKALHDALNINADTVDGVHAATFATKTGAETLENKTISKAVSATVGDVDGGNYTEVETDGTFHLHGDATCYDDLLVEIKNEQPFEFATAGTLVNYTASGTTGSYLDTEIRNMAYWTIREGGSAGQMFNLTFENIMMTPVMFFSGKYDGSPTHASSLKWQAYNYVTDQWNTLSSFTFTDEVEYADIGVTGITSQHVSGTGQVKIGLDHPGTPSATHYFYLDQIYLAQNNKPKILSWKGSKVRAFDNSGNITATFEGQLPHSYQLESDLYPHLHIVPLTQINQGDTLKFDLTYTLAAIGDVFPTETTVSVTYTASENIPADTHTLIPLTNIDGTGLGISSILSGRITREVGTHTGVIAIKYLDFHFKKDTLGSREPLVK